MSNLKISNSKFEIQDRGKVALLNKFCNIGVATTEQTCPCAQICLIASIFFVYLRLWRSFLGKRSFRFGIAAKKMKTPRRELVSSRRFYFTIYPFTLYPSGSQQHSTNSRAAFTSSMRPNGVLCGAECNSSGLFLASSAILMSASAKASRVSLFSVSVGSIISASWTMSGK